MRRYRNYKEHLVEKLKDVDYASAYLNACLEESFRNQKYGYISVSCSRCC